MATLSYGTEAIIRLRDKFNCIVVNRNDLFDNYLCLEVLIMNFKIDGQF